MAAGGAGSGDELERTVDLGWSGKGLAPGARRGARSGGYIPTAVVIRLCLFDGGPVLACFWLCTADVEVFSAWFTGYTKQSVVFTIQSPWYF